MHLVEEKLPNWQLVTCTLEHQLKTTIKIDKKRPNEIFELLPFKLETGRTRMIIKQTLTDYSLIILKSSFHENTNTEY